MSQKNESVRQSRPASGQQNGLAQFTWLGQTYRISANKGSIKKCRLARQSTKKEEIGKYCSSQQNRRSDQSEEKYARISTVLSSHHLCRGTVQMHMLDSLVSIREVLASNNLTSSNLQRLVLQWSQQTRYSDGNIFCEPKVVSVVFWQTLVNGHMRNGGVIYTPFYHFCGGWMLFKFPKATRTRASDCTLHPPSQVHRIEISIHL